jgi:deoxycytidine triphosphate deaminase
MVITRLEVIEGVESMMLTDRQIRERVEKGQLIVAHYVDENVNCISYDLTIDCFIAEEERSEYSLAPGEFVMVRTQEELSIPDDLSGVIGEKNSRLRQGLVVMGPRYFPGHTTYAFLRVQNISSNTITLKKGNKIAQVFFEKLDEVPEHTYQEQTNASFNNEETYMGYGKYQSEYSKQEKSFQSVKDSILEKEQQIYANVLTFMGIIVAVFSMITINYEAFAQANVGTKYIIVMNLTLVLCICVLMGLILIIINNAKNKKFIWLYTAILAILAIATIVFAFVAV